MCDTLIATQLATTNGIAIFGKNSDRPPNESQNLVYLPAQTHPAGSPLKCTYIEIPQVQRTNAIFLSQPYWMWGAEMGINEHGLVIGNEAIYSKIPANKEPALLGMDLLRLGLERAATPREAIQVITELLEAFGQGGNCFAPGETMYYHNSFLLANAEEAWALETVDKHWAARKINDIYTISNCLTIADQYDLSSANLVDLAIQKGVSKSKTQFQFANDFSDFLYTTFSQSRQRRAATLNVLDAQKGKIAIETMIGALRHHNGENHDPQNSLTEFNVCSHAGFGPIRASQSTASLVAYLDPNRPLIFATGTSAPCTGIFKPFWLDAASGLNLGPASTAQADSSLYWTHEKLHRATLLNYPERLKAYATDRDALEKQFTEGALALHSASAEERREYSNRCLAEASKAEAEWLKRVEKIPVKTNLLYAAAWKRWNRRAKLTI
ncbi:MAG: C69 family dipeptidase [Anaerolineales bacterium]|nr:C69 family dipeptidase [Anaerolineales bacterium]